MAGPPDPGFDEILREFRDRRGLAVRFLSYPSHADLPKLLNEATALLFPSSYEGFGLPILEAMACGTPVVTSNVSSMPEVAGDAAILVGPHDAGAVSLAMTLLAGRDERWLGMSNRGLVRASEFSWDATGARTASVLRALCL